MSLRAKVDLEVFHSVEYLQTRSRCSHHVCYQLKGYDASIRRYGRVLRYYKMQETWAQGTFRFCEMDCFREITTEEDNALGYGTVSKASPDTMFVALEDFRRKVISYDCDILFTDFGKKSRYPFRNLIQRAFRLRGC